MDDKAFRILEIMLNVVRKGVCSREYSEILNQMSNKKVMINKQQISSKGLIEKSKEKGGTNSILVTDSVTGPKQGHKQQSYDDKQKSRSI